jgi:hypothetical protein
MIELIMYLMSGGARHIGIGLLPASIDMKGFEWSIERRAVSMMMMKNIRLDISHSYNQSSVFRPKSWIGLFGWSVHQTSL